MAGYLLSPIYWPGTLVEQPIWGGQFNTAMNGTHTHNNNSDVLPAACILLCMMSDPEGSWITGSNRTVIDGKRP